MIRIFTIALIVALSGCAMFEGGHVPKTTLAPYEDNGHSKPNITYSSTAMGGLGSAKLLPEAAQHIIEGEFLAVLESSDYFGRIAKNDASADISIDVTLTNSGNPAAMIPAFITGYSLYTIPSWATDTFNLVAKVERQDGLRKEYTLSDSTTLVQWLPMIFFVPFKNASVIPEVRKNMYRKVLSDMKEDGFFDIKTVDLTHAH